MDYKDTRAEAQQWLKEGGNPYIANAMDVDGRVGIDYGVYGVPETYRSDRDGRIRQRWVGPLTPARVTQEVLPLLRQLQAK